MKGEGGCLRYLIALLLSLVLVASGGRPHAEMDRAEPGAPVVVQREHRDSMVQLRAPQGPCRGLSVKQTIRCAVALWPVPGGVSHALYIADRESNFLQWAISPGGCCLGVYQIHRDHMPHWPNDVMQGPWWERWFPNLVRHDSNMLFKGRFNVMLAIRVAHLRGWGPWT